MIIDGLNFDNDVTKIFEGLEDLNQEFNIFTWLSMKSHRDEALSEDGFPIQLETYKDRFDKALFLQPVEDKIEAVILKDGDRTDLKCKLDPSTMMVLE